MSECIQPVLLGADLNCYSMARAFFAACGRSSLAYGQTTLGATAHSRYVRFTAEPSLGKKEVLFPLLARLLKGLPPNERAMLIPCTDEYARLLIEEGETLPSSCLVPLPPPSALAFFEKSAFYAACREQEIPYPDTISLSAMPSLSAIRAAGEQLGFPFIIKPSSSVTYWHYPFAGMEKVYLAHNKNEAECVLAGIFGSGYPGEVLLQRYIPGGDAAGYVLTVYMDRGGRVRLRACGRVLLEEHTPCGKGNYAALVTVPVPEIAKPLCHLLAAVGYRGFANFDLRQDVHDGRFYALEVNLRLGRSNYFLTAGGQNPAAWLLDDYVRHTALPCVDMENEVLFRTVPYAVVRRYTARDEDADLAQALHRAGRDACPLYDRDDLVGNPLRALYVAAHMRREKQKFRQYCARIR
ncbi:MAG: ATP-grasp domain-containing protein [Clostridia bacterium]|nr:ATP-grasp domain-containing protein [Clostridia bacterium]